MEMPISIEEFTCDVLDVYDWKSALIYKYDDDQVVRL